MKISKEEVLVNAVALVVTATLVFIYTLIKR